RSRLRSSRKPWQTPLRAIRPARRLASSAIYSQRHHPCAFSLPQGDPQVLGTNLKCSEFETLAGPQSASSQTTIAHGDRSTAEIRAATAEPQTRSEIFGAVHLGIRAQRLPERPAQLVESYYGPSPHGCWCAAMSTT